MTRRAAHLRDTVHCGHAANPTWVVLVSPKRDGNALPSQDALRYPSHVSEQPRSYRKHWFYPVVGILSIAVGLYAVLYFTDVFLHRPTDFRGGYFDFSDDRITDAVGGLSGLFAAILGILITVVSIIVQLTAERFTHVTQMFLRDKTNLRVLGFYVLACVCGVLNSFSIHVGWVPRITLTAMIIMAIIAFAVMAPYFAYVFDFLQPENIISRIRAQAIVSSRSGARATDEAKRADGQARTLHSMEELTDITINSINGKDKLIAVAAVDALKDLAVAYLADKKAATLDWFRVGPGIRKNPDFVSMAEASVDEMERRHTWVEWKVLRQCQAIYHEALANMKDVAYVCAIDTRYIGEQTIRVGDREALAVCVKFFNSYLRATLNARDVRTAYNVLHQYRELTEALMRAGWHDKAIEIAGYIKYYAHLAYRILPFVTEVCAYDLCRLCEIAHAIKSPIEAKLLRIFLEVDQPTSEDSAEESGLRGVRKAQVKLATYYIVQGAEALVRIIWEDMRHERPERLRSIQEELLQVESEDFWEVVDRGTNFDYLPPERKAALGPFFDWFTQSKPPAAEPAAGSDTIGSTPDRSGIPAAKASE